MYGPADTGRCSEEWRVEGLLCYVCESVEIWIPVSALIVYAFVAVASVAGYAHGSRTHGLAKRVLHGTSTCTYGTGLTLAPDVVEKFSSGSVTRWELASKLSLASVQERNRLLSAQTNSGKDKS